MKRFTTSDGLSLAYRDDGQGPPLLCLPGLTRNSLDFDPVVAAFADRARVIRLDFRGRGASDHDPDIANYNILVESRDTWELLAHLGISHTSVLGTSRGGQVAMLMAAQARDHLTGVALNDIGPVLEPVGLDRIRDYLGRRPPFASLDAAAAATAGAMAHQFPGVDAAAWRTFLGRNWTETPDGLELAYDPRLRDAMEAQIEAGLPPDIWPLFEALAGLPVLVLRGGNSDLFSAASADEMARRHPGLDLVTVPDRGHVPFLDEPEVVAALEAFLDRLAAG